MIVAILSGVAVGFIIGKIYSHFSVAFNRRETLRLNAQFHAMSERVKLLTAKTKRLKEIGIVESDEEIENGIMKGIDYVLKEKLSKI